MAQEKKFETMKRAELPFMDSAEPGKKLPKEPFGGNWVKPEDRMAKVNAQAPKEETAPSPSGNLFEPDKSGNYGIRDKAPQDR